jgi:hypothetical protein
MLKTLNPTFYSEVGGCRCVGAYVANVSSTVFHPKSFTQPSAILPNTTREINLGKQANRSPPPFPDHHAMPLPHNSFLDEYSHVNQNYLMLCDLVPAAIRPPPPPRLHGMQDPGRLRQRIFALQTAMRTLQKLWLMLQRPGFLLPSLWLPLARLGFPLPCTSKTQQPLNHLHLKSDKKPSQEAELRLKLAQDPLPAVVQQSVTGTLPSHLRILFGPPGHHQAVSLSPIDTVPHTLMLKE